jgi:hypothetical protein
VIVTSRGRTWEIIGATQRLGHGLVGTYACASPAPRGPAAKESPRGDRRPERLTQPQDYAEASEQLAAHGRRSRLLLGTGRVAGPRRGIPRGASAAGRGSTRESSQRGSKMARPLWTPAQPDALDGHDRPARCVLFRKGPEARRGRFAPIPAISALRPLRPARNRRCARRSPTSAFPSPTLRSCPLLSREGVAQRGSVPAVEVEGGMPQNFLDLRARCSKRCSPGITDPEQFAELSKSRMRLLKDPAVTRGPPEPVSDRASRDHGRAAARAHRHA